MSANEPRPTGHWTEFLARKPLVQRFAEPLERFMHVEASSGIVLLVAAMIALIWANSGFHESYEALWHTPFAVGLGEWVFEKDLHFWINDFLMAVFFFVVGLEIKREIFEGALSDIRQAALPIAAAIGGMVVPALIYLALNFGGAGQHGWGVPMATDIAFAVGVLTLLGKRVPPAMRILLLAIAIIDDIGAILVIAVFYSTGIQLDGLFYVVGGILAIQALNWAGVRPGLLWALPPLVVWAGMLRLGVHPTIAGVIVGLMTPIKPWLNSASFLAAARAALDEFQRLAADGLDEGELNEPLTNLSRARREAIGPAVRIEAALHPWVAFFIMPLFALANAGVNLGGIGLDVAGVPAVMLGIIVGLPIGKLLGIVGFSWIAVKAGWCRLPAGVGWRSLAVLGAAGGIGFTMAIFIAELAFAGSPFRGPAKLAVLIGTAVAGLAALGGGYIVLREQPKDVTDLSLRDVESSIEYWTLGATGRPKKRPTTRTGFQVRM